jgi:hypothetical protein
VAAFESSFIGEGLEPEEIEQPCEGTPPVNYEIYEEPKISINLWNVRGRVFDELPRCNNSMEAFNGAFKVC